MTWYPAAAERRHEPPPAVGQLREAVQQQDARPRARLRPGFQHVHAQAVDVGDEPGADAAREHACGVGTQAVALRRRARRRGARRRGARGHSGRGALQELAAGERGRRHRLDYATSRPGLDAWPSECRTGSPVLHLPRLAALPASRAVAQPSSRRSGGPSLARLARGRLCGRLRHLGVHLPDHPLGRGEIVFRASCETRDRPSFSLPESAGRGTVSGRDAAFAGWQ